MNTILVLLANIGMTCMHTYVPLRQQGTKTLSPTFPIRRLAARIQQLASCPDSIAPVVSFCATMYHLAKSLYTYATSKEGTTSTPTPTAPAGPDRKLPGIP